MDPVPESFEDPSVRNLTEGDADETEDCKRDEQEIPSKRAEIVDWLSGKLNETVYRGNGKVQDYDFKGEFANRAVSQAAGKASNPGNIHLWGAMSDATYKSMVHGILAKANVAEHGLVVESGAGMGKLAAIAIDGFHLSAIGIEPAWPSVCAGKKVFADIFKRNAKNGLHKGDANDLSRVDTGTADLALTLGVVCYFPDITYLCQVLSEQLRVLKPGGTLMNAWVLDAPDGKGDDKLNIKKEFWGNSTVGALPACASTISQQVDNKTLEIDQGCSWCGPGNGYGVYMRKKSGVSTLAPGSLITLLVLLVQGLQPCA